ncbi:hypothetical protein LUCX_322 [Xanthomonas phage vB_XciM_LucasX]|nr:hypothetical protein LUCX_322 [Xanthomonas phage vB_XciM_LucasX]
MHSMTSPHPGTSSRVRAVVEFCLSKLVSEHAKRIIFVTSLYARMSRLEKLQAAAIDKLNHFMVLATNSASLPLPSRLQNVIWKSTSLNDMLSPEILKTPLTPEQRRELSTKVVDITPGWLRYGTKPSMIDDVGNLLSPSGRMAMA